MINFQDPILKRMVNQLDFATNMRINDKYITMQKYYKGDNKLKIEKLIKAFYSQTIIRANNVIDILTNNPHFISKLENMSDEQIDEYIMLCGNASLGVLINNKHLIRKYSTDEHIKICKIHLAYGENPLLASIIDLAAKYHAKFPYIKKVIEIVMDPKNRKEWTNYIDTILVDDNFYNIKSDFERLIILNHIVNTDDSYAKSLYKHLATNPIFTTHNDAYYLIDLVKKLVILNDPEAVTALITELNTHPGLTRIYSPSDLLTIMRYIHDIPHAQSYFFNPFVLTHFNGKEIMKIYSLADDTTYEDISSLLSNLRDIIDKNLPLIPTLENIYSHNLDKEVTLDYKPNNREVIAS